MESRIQELLILFCNSYELRKCLLIGDSEVSQHLAVDFNASLRQAVDELAVGDTVRTCSSIDTSDPEATEVALLRTAVTPTFTLGMFLSS